MDGSEDKYGVCSTRVPYAMITLLTQGDKFVATVETKGAFEVNEYVDICMGASSLSFSFASLTPLSYFVYAVFAAFPESAHALDE